MKLGTASSRAAALLWLTASIEAAHHGHHHTHHQHHKANIQVKAPLKKKGGHCKFPSDAGLVAVTPSSLNGDWAMSPDQSCTPGNYCPYACPSSQMSVQWDPKATLYSYPMSINGGLYCDENGELQKPFPDRPYYADGMDAVVACNKCKLQVSFYQMVLPGNEAMLIPNLIEDLATLAVLNTEYWCETSAHFYINPPGIDTETACAWGTSSNPYGNWAPYVAGANTTRDGSTFVKLGWNLIYLEPTTPFCNVMPDYGVKIKCKDGGCNDLPCKIDLNINSVNEVTGETTTGGAGDSAFCVVIVPKGEKAHIVVFKKDGGDEDASSATVAIPTSSAASSTLSTSTTTTSSSTSSASSMESSSTSSTSSTTSLSTKQTASITPSLSWNPSSSGMVMSAHWLSVSASISYQPHVFIETGTAAAATAATAAMQTSAAASPSLTPEEGGAATATASKLAVMLGVCAATLVLSL